MSREIKFRVKIKGDARVYPVWIIDFLNHRVYVYRACGYEWVTFDKIQALMQYTGLKDKNDQEIYEGDIVHCWGGEYCQGYWEHDSNITIKNMVNDCFMMGEHEFLEVIGNIYEHPHLLKED